MRASKLASCAAVLSLAAADIPYRTEIEGWRSQHEAELQADDGWLAVAGLFWLKDGSNSAGAGASSDIVLPHGPARIGVFEFHNGKTAFRAEPGAGALVNGRAAVLSAELKPDSSTAPDQVQVDGMTLFVIHRGNRYGIRLRDPRSQPRKEFTGLRWYPVAESARVRAKFFGYAKPRMIPITNVLGETEPELSPGFVEFTMHGRELRLEPVLEDGRLFFIFRDLTAGAETYPAGRFLYAGAPKGGEVELDFNKAENPPCAFTAFATCPLPPKQNRLPVRIEAGELNYAHHPR